MRSFMTLAAAVVVAFMMVSLTGAEIVELQTGQRLEGVVKSVTATDVLLDVAGQSLTFPRGKVSAIYFGASPKGGSEGQLDNALRVLKGLRSATTAAISYRDYAPRVIDAKIQVDQMLNDAPDGLGKTALAEALALYVYASKVWNAEVTRSYSKVFTWNPLLNRNPLVDKCEPLRRLIERSDSSELEPAEVSLRKSEMSAKGVSLLVHCANERVVEAERLLHGH